MDVDEMGGDTHHGVRFPSAEQVVCLMPACIATVHMHKSAAGMAFIHGSVALQGQSGQRTQGASVIRAWVTHDA